MNRRTFLRRLAVFAAAPAALTACGRTHSRPSSPSRTAATDSTRYTAPVDVSSLRVHPVLDTPTSMDDVDASAWRSLLSDDAFGILFEAGTERPGSSALLDEKRRGTFVCAACHLPLFPSTTKYESGTGWPSFWAPLPNRIGTMRDTKLSVPRVEYHCKRCGGHQGHVFTDGPDPTGLRYCNNGLALRFVPESEPLPDSRTPTA